jgi:hypothetical protein
VIFGATKWVRCQDHFVVPGFCFFLPSLSELHGALILVLPGNPRDFKCMPHAVCDRACDQLLPTYRPVKREAE